MRSVIDRTQVQYPEVATLYAADFDNLEVVTRWLFPENVALIRGLRARHSAELDFRTEAQNLREVSANMRARGFEPELVRVPTVPEERLCTRHVLVMEYLDGCSLASAIDAEYATMASALGYANGAELRQQLMRRVQQHFESGGGARRFIQAAEAVAPLVRAYARLVAAIGAWCARAAAVLGLGHLAPSTPSEPFPPAAVDLGRAIRTLVRAHGVAMLLDGVYNAE